MEDRRMAHIERHVHTAWNSFCNRWLEECETDDQKVELIDYMIRKLQKYRNSLLGIESAEYRCEECGTVYRLKIPYCKVCQNRMNSRED